MRPRQRQDLLITCVILGIPGIPQQDRAASLSPSLSFLKMRDLKSEERDPHKDPRGSGTRCSCGWFSLSYFESPWRLETYPGYLKHISTLSGRGPGSWDSGGSRAFFTAWIPAHCNHQQPRGLRARLGSSVPRKHGGCHSTVQSRGDVMMHTDSPVPQPFNFHYGHTK